MVATAANRRRGVLLAQRFHPPGSPVELHRLGSRAELLRLDESHHQPRVILHRAHYDYRIRDDPILCAYMQSCAHFENRFSPAAVRTVAVHGESSRRHWGKVPRLRKAQSVMFVSYARQIGRVINSYSQPLARLFLVIIYLTHQFMLVNCEHENEESRFPWDAPRRD